MGNLIQNYFNRPGEYKKGQIWHCNNISEDIVLTDVYEQYLKIGIVRGMILCSENYLGDNLDLKFKPKGDLKSAYSLSRIMLRITDGPLLTDDLSFYVGEVPKTISSKIPNVLKSSPDLNPVQEEFSAKYLAKLQPMREKVMIRFEKYEKDMSNLKILIVLKVLNMLKKNAKRVQYRTAAADESDKMIFDEFWDKERDAINQSVILNEDAKSIFRLVSIDGRLYMTVKSDTIKKLSDIKLIQKKTRLASVDTEINFGKEKRVFTSFENDSKLKAGDWEMQLKIDGKNVKFSFRLE